MEGVNGGGEESSMKSEEWEDLSGVFEELVQTMEEEKEKEGEEEWKEEELRTSLEPTQEPLEQQQHPAQQVRPFQERHPRFRTSTNAILFNSFLLISVFFFFYL